MTHRNQAPMTHIMPQGHRDWQSPAISQCLAGEAAGPKVRPFLLPSHSAPTPSHPASFKTQNKLGLGTKAQAEAWDARGRGKGPKVDSNSLQAPGSLLQ